MCGGTGAGERWKWEVAVRRAMRRILGLDRGGPRSILGGWQEGS